MNKTFKTNLERKVSQQFPRKIANKMVKRQVFQSVFVVVENAFKKVYQLNRKQTHLICSFSPKLTIPGP